MKATEYRGYEITDGDCYYPFWVHFAVMAHNTNDCDEPNIYGATVDDVKEQIDEILNDD